MFSPPTDGIALATCARSAGDICIITAVSMTSSKPRAPTFRPSEVEAALLKIAGVASAHVAGVPDRVRGSVVGALLVRSPAQGSMHDVRSEAARSLSSFKVPRVILIVESSKVPTLPSSKIDRRAVAKLLQEAHERTP